MRSAEKMTERDILTLRSIRSLSSSSPRGTRQENDAYFAKLAQLEASLSDVGRKVYLTWPSRDVTVELKRWKAAYRLVRTQRGLSAFRWIGHRKDYAKRAIATGMDEVAAAAFRGLIRV